MSASGPESLNAAAEGLRRRQRRHIVDVLIQERAPTLLGHPLLGPVGRGALYPLLGYREAVRIADAIAGLDGVSAMALLSRELTLDVSVEGADLVPADGPVLVVSNHPTGIADGVVVFDALRELRPDLMLFANRDAIRVAPGFEDLVIPVEWVPGKRTRARTRETLAATQGAFGAGRALVMFPSGRLAFMDDGALRERPWLPTAVGLARRHGVPIVPMHIEGRNSRLFYLFSRVSDQLRDITLFHEVLNKRGRAYRVRFGERIAPEQLTGDPVRLTARLQAHVEAGLTAPFSGY